MYTNHVKILNIKPCTLDMGDENCIIDAYVLLELNSMNVWCFVHNWRAYFPYQSPYHPYGIGESLIKNLKDKTIEVTLKFLNLKTELSNEKTRKIAFLPKRKKPCDYVITGEIVNKEDSPILSEKFEHLWIDCGFVVGGIGVEENRFKIGDCITIEGRLDAYITGLPP